MRYTLSYTIAAIGQEAVSVVTVLRARQYLSTTVTSTYPETPRPFQRPVHILHVFRTPAGHSTAEQFRIARAKPQRDADVGRAVRSIVPPAT